MISFNPEYESFIPKQEHVDEFIKLYKERYNIELDGQAALEALISLIVIYKYQEENKLRQTIQENQQQFTYKRLLDLDDSSARRQRKKSSQYQKQYVVNLKSC